MLTPIERIAKILNIFRPGIRIPPEIASAEASGTGANLEAITKTPNIDQVTISERAKKDIRKMFIG
ncbi:MAG: hypothetical protein QF362_04865 [Candidatus Woesearchaeota archaeon]|nr:hypothetical protein [Candidatus Woesearchaeota archaeon]MDP7506743.1 hypothetical protein [Candidatus Woesearchaeota archaeon]